MGRNVRLMGSVLRELVRVSEKNWVGVMVTVRFLFNPKLLAIL